MAAPYPLLDHDVRQLADTGYLAGVDEAGRGALAGPVYAGCVVLTGAFYASDWCRTNAHKINDSKQLTSQLRDELYAELHTLAAAGQLALGIGSGTVAEIARYNILGATRLAMQRALEQAAAAAALTLPAAAASAQPDLFSPTPCAAPASPVCILVDGRPLKPFPYRHTALVKGDGCSLAIAMASILAKVARDTAMRQLHEHYPHYAFAHHKGYGTATHQQALRQHGPCLEHRVLFLRKLGGG